MPSEPLTEHVTDPSNPIMDDPTTLDELYRAGLPGDAPDKEPASWEEPITKMAESQASLAEMVTNLASTFQEYIARPAQQVVYREPAPVVKEPEPEAPWRSKVKPEQAELLDEIVRTGIQQGIKDFKEKELYPTLQYVVSGVERLQEEKMKRDNDDEDFGYGALEAETKAYRAATGFNIDLETAYNRVAFDKMATALKGARKLQSDRAKKDKTENVVDEGGTQPDKPGDSDELDASERRAARAFFAGQDPRSGKLRSPQEIDELWMEHKKGAKRDELPD